MFFKNRKGQLKRKYDQKLLTQMELLKEKWEREKFLLNHTVDVNENLKKQVQLAEKKYFYLFKEAKARKININDYKK
ncbi:YaaL family protein [Fervidibacillus halotolerans]|uniref:YaaL family protein n=1 Tax=Fervidibacillus halotolerans TaxID=2980027 RepID=A0A9E8LZ98_9BACI|nr:YaaL family protein [Fervidibacillus halotolerans]WAA12319.1 YaaL family protein [Fervidibacillus halotolerans]